MVVKKDGAILMLAGDGIGVEVMAQATRVLQCLNEMGACQHRWRHELIGGASYDQHGEPLTQETLRAACAADAVLLGAVGGDQWNDLPFDKKPERGLLALRKGMELYANLRPAVVFDPLANSSTLKKDIVKGLDMMIIRELTGGIYFGEPRGIETLQSGKKRGINSLVYDSDEIERIGRMAFDIARVRKKILCSVDKANVLECTLLWREVMTQLAEEYQDVTLTHMYVDNAAMQLIRHPAQFDVVVTTNMFGDILSDAAAMLTGSLGMLPSASLGAAQEGNKRLGLYEPVHGSAPDIAGLNKANPLAMILSVAMMLRWSFADEGAARAVELAVADVLRAGHRTPDLIHEGDATACSTSDMGAHVCRALTQRL